jgi:hypothetical protein
LRGRSVAALRRAISGVGVPIGLIAVVGCGHAREPIAAGPAVPFFGALAGWLPTPAGRKARCRLRHGPRPRMPEASRSFGRQWSSSPTTTASRSRA